MAEAVPAETVGFIGLGAMGALMAGRLADAGYAVLVHDVREDVVAAFCRAHATARPGRSLAETAAAVSIVITMLPTSREVRAVVLGEGGDALLPSLSARSIVVDMTSGVPTETDAIARIVEGRGAALLDAPVSGGIKGAREGALAIMVGGPESAIARVRPLLEHMGRRIFRAGDVGAGQAIKALNNFVSAMGLMAAGEALVVGQRFGLDPAVMVDIINASTGRNNSTENKLKPLVLSGTFAGGFALRLMRKDLAIARALAEGVEAPGGVAAWCSAVWDKAADALPSGADHTDIVRWLGYSPEPTDACGSPHSLAADQHLGSPR